VGQKYLQIPKMAVGKRPQRPSGFCALVDPT
jgi:hypothetical protein